MQASELYKCIADPQRLRILNLLDAGPLCVCHVQEILNAPQVKISKQLALMKQLRLIHAEREGTWMIYRLAEPVNPLLRTNLDYLCKADCAECNQFSADLKARERMVKKISRQSSECPAPVYATIGCC